VPEGETDGLGVAEDPGDGLDSGVATGTGTRISGLTWLNEDALGTGGS
jgi:hypothetical protein